MLPQIISSYRRNLQYYKDDPTSPSRGNVANGSPRVEAVSPGAGLSGFSGQKSARSSLKLNKGKLEGKNNTLEPMQPSKRSFIASELEADDKNVENIGVSNAIASLENHLNASKTIDADSFAFREMQSKFVENWMDSINKASSFESFSVFCEIKLNEVFTATSSQPLPNTLRTQICCALFEKLCDSAFGPYRDLIKILKNELFRSIYIDYDVHADLKSSIVVERKYASKAMSALTDLAASLDQNNGNNNSVRFERAKTILHRARTISLKDNNAENKDFSFAKDGLAAVQENEEEDEEETSINILAKQSRNKSLQIDRNSHGFTTKPISPDFSLKLPFFADFVNLSAENLKLSTQLSDFKKNNERLIRFQEVRSRASEKRAEERLKAVVINLFLHWKSETKKHVLLWKKIKMYVFGAELNLRDNFIAWRVTAKSEKEKRKQDIAVLAEGGEVLAEVTANDTDYDEMIAREQLLAKQLYNETVKLKENLEETTRKLSLAEQALSANPDTMKYVNKLDNSDSYILYIATVVEHRVQTLRNEISLIYSHKYMDANRLGLVDPETLSAFKIADLAFIEPPNLLLNWLNSRLSHYITGSEKRVITDFSSDFSDGTVFLSILGFIFPSVNFLSRISFEKLDLLEQATYIVTQLTDFRINSGGFVAVSDLVHQKPDFNFYLTFQLLKKDPCLSVPNDYFAKESALIDEAFNLLNDFRRGKILFYETQERLSHLETILNRAEESLQSLYVKLSEGNSLFEAMCSKLQEFADSVVGARVHGNITDMSSFEESDAASSSFTQVSLDRISDIFYKYDNLLCDPLVQTNNIQDIFSKNTTALKKIFRTYVMDRDRHKDEVETRVRSMNSSEYMKFVHDAKISLSKNGSLKMSLADIDQIFWLVNRVNEKVVKTGSGFSKEVDTVDSADDSADTSGKNAVVLDILVETKRSLGSFALSPKSGNNMAPPSLHNEEETDNPDIELVPVEWIEAIIRIADRKYDVERLDTKVELLLNNHILKYITAANNASEASAFRKSLRSDEMNAVYMKFRRALKLIFCHYGSHGTKMSYVTSMTCNEFISMVKDSCITNGAFPISTVKSIIAQVQEIEGDNLEPEIVYTEFQEILACISLYKDPNPFIPMSKKASLFISKDILPHLVSKVKGLSRVPLGIISDD